MSFRRILNSLARRNSNDSNGISTISSLGRLSRRNAPYLVAAVSMICLVTLIGYRPWPYLAGSNKCTLTCNPETRTCSYAARSVANATNSSPRYLPPSARLTRGKSSCSRIICEPGSILCLPLP